LYSVTGDKVEVHLQRSRYHCHNN